MTTAVQPQVHPSAPVAGVSGAGAPGRLTPEQAEVTRRIEAFLLMAIPVQNAR